MKKWMATLMGGPCDGQVVEVLGCYYAKLFQRYIDDPFDRLFEARYMWESAGGNKMVGLFAGYFRGNQKVDKLGRKLRRVT